MKFANRTRKISLALASGAFVAAMASPAMAQDPYTETPPPPTPTPEIEVLGIQVNKPEAQVAGLPITGADIAQIGALGMWTVAFGGALVAAGRRRISGRTDEDGDA